MGLKNVQYFLDILQVVDSSTVFPGLSKRHGALCIVVKRVKKNDKRLCNVPWPRSKYSSATWLLWFREGSGLKQESCLLTELPTRFANYIAAIGRPLRGIRCVSHSSDLIIIWEFRWHRYAQRGSQTWTRSVHSKVQTRVDHADRDALKVKSSTSHNLFSSGTTE